MASKLNLILLICVVLFCGESLYAQQWKELGRNEKVRISELLKENNSGEGCYHISYKIYNFTKKSTPTQSLEGIQCKQGDTSVINVFSQNFSYSDSVNTISVDSSNKVLTIGYNLALMDVKNRGAEAFAQLIENSGLMYEGKQASGQQILKINSLESNGIAYYIFRLRGDYSLEEIEIHYEEQKEERYNMDPEISIPIMVIGFKPSENSLLEKMLSADYFITNIGGKVTPSKHFKDFTINDTRIAPNQDPH